MTATPNPHRQLKTAKVDVRMTEIEKVSLVYWSQVHGVKPSTFLCACAKEKINELAKLSGE